MAVQLELRLYIIEVVWLATHIGRESRQCVSCSLPQICRRGKNPLKHLETFKVQLSQASRLRLRQLTTAMFVDAWSKIGNTEVLGGQPIAVHRLVPKSIGGLHMR